MSSNNILKSPYLFRGKHLGLYKTYQQPDFRSKTIFTDNVFPYVKLFLTRKDAKLKFASPNSESKFGPAGRFAPIFFWQQAEYYYNATLTSSLELKPLLSYYCMLNAAKAYLAQYTEKLDDAVNMFTSHGLKEDRSNTFKEKSLSNIQITRENKGVFVLFGTKLNKDFDAIWSSSTKFTLKELLYNMPFVHRSFCATYNKARGNKIEELFLPLILGESPSFHVVNSRLVLAANLKSDIQQKLLTHIPTDFVCRKEKISTGENIIQIRSISDSKKNVDSISQETKDLADKLRKQFVYISNPKKLWYLKRDIPQITSITSQNATSSLSQSNNLHNIKLSTLTLNMAIMHRFSEIVRYQPQVLQSLLESEESWLIQEYINHALLQFVDEIACEITKRDIMGTAKF